MENFRPLNGKRPRIASHHALYTSVWTLGVHALSALATIVRTSLTFIYILAGNSISIETDMTGTLIRARGIGAVGIFIARMYSNFTFVNIYTLVAMVSAVTLTRIGTKGVSTVRMRWAGIITRCTLIDIWGKRADKFQKFDQVVIDAYKGQHRCFWIWFFLRFTAQVRNYSGRLQTLLLLLLLLLFR